MTDMIPRPARERILSAAYDLFTRRGVKDVTVSEIIQRSGVAIATFYRQFGSKEKLVEACLERRAQVWTTDSIVTEARERSRDARGALLAIFDIFDEWFNGDSFEGDSFVNVLIEMGSQHALGRASIVHLARVRRSVFELAVEAELRDPDGFAHSYQILMVGSAIASTMGDKLAARRAQKMVENLLAEHSP